MEVDADRGFFPLAQGLNKKALQQLSMLERRIGKGELFAIFS